MPLDWLGWASGLESTHVNGLRLLKVAFLHVIYPGVRWKPVYFSRTKMMVIIILAPLHILACMWSALGKQNLIDTETETWYTHPLGSTWLAGIAEGGLSDWQHYCVSLHWVTETVSATGHVSVWPVSSEEIIFCIVLFIIGMTSYRLIMGEVSSRVMSADEHMIKLREERGAVKSYIANLNIPEKDALAQAIKKHFHTSRDVGTVDMKLIVNSLPYNLSLEIMSQVSRGLLSQVEIFKNCSTGFLNRISVLLVEVHFTVEEQIFATGDVSSSMYIVTDGKVTRMFGDKDGTLHENGRVVRGGSIGGVSFAFGTRHGSTAQAGPTGAHCLSLGRDEYVQVLRQYPEDEDVVMQNALFAFERDKAQKNSSIASRGSTIQPMRPVPDADEDSEHGSDLQEGEPSDDGVECRSMDESDEDSIDDFEWSMGKGIRDRISSLKKKLRAERVKVLCNAAALGDVEGLKSKLGSFVHVNDTDTNGRTALHVACSEGRIKMVEFLLDTEADPAIADSHGNYPLMDALQHSHREVQRRLTPAAVCAVPTRCADVPGCNAGGVHSASQAPQLEASVG